MAKYYLIRKTYLGGPIYLKDAPDQSIGWIWDSNSKAARKLTAQKARVFTKRLKARGDEVEIIEGEDWEATP